MEEKKKKFTVDKLLFGIPMAIYVILIIYGFVDNESFLNFGLMGGDFVIKYFGTWVNVLVFAMVVFVIVLFCSKGGKVRIGGPDAKPEFSKMSWFAMALCAGAGVGLSFFGVAEPMSHFMEPPTGLYGMEAGTSEAAKFAISATVFHWAFIPYVIYTLIGIGIAYAVYNKGLPFRVSSAFYPVLGDRVLGIWGKVIDIAIITFFIVSTIPSVGFVMMQIAAGLNYVYGIPKTMTVYVILIIICTVVFSFGSYSGIKKAIKWFSDINFKMYLGIMLFLVIFGNGVFISALGVDAFSNYIGRVIPDLLVVDAFGDSNGWTENWTKWYWLWWISGAPITAMFMARISKGNTIREYIVVNLLGGGIFGTVWFTIFGGAAIWQQHSGTNDIWAVMQNLGKEAATFSMFEGLPAYVIVAPIFLVCIFISFVTLMEAICTSMAIYVTNMTVEDVKAGTEPPGLVKIAFGVMFGLSAIVILMTGSGSALQAGGVLGGLPIMFLYALCLVGLYKELIKKKTIDERLDSPTPKKSIEEK